MDSNNENEESLNLEQCFHRDTTHYTVNYSHGSKTEGVIKLLLRFLIPIAYTLMKQMCSYLQTVCDKNEDFNKKK